MWRTLSFGKHGFGLLWLVALAIGFCFFAPSAHATNYQYYRAITVTSTASIASGTNTNFPMLVSNTVASWASTAHGGHIQNLTTAPNGGPEAADLVFATSSANCNATPLNFETESYNSSTGALVDWVNVPTMQAGSVIYACYDNSSVATDQSHASSTWNSNYDVVYHLSAPTGTIDLDDSTANANNGSGNAVTVTSIIDGGAGSNPVTYGEIDSATSTVFASTTSYTASMWAYAPNLTNSSANQFYLLDRTEAINQLIQFFPAIVNQATTTMSFRVRGDNGLGLTTVTTAANSFISSNQWFLITGVVDKSTGIMSIFLNGLQAGTTTYGMTGTTTFQGAIGGASADGGNWLGVPGSNYGNEIDEYNLLSTALSPSWIATEYNNQLSPSTFYAMGSESSFDSTPPSVTLTSPLSGATVSSTISLVASSTATIGIQGIQFQIDGTNLGSLVTATSGGPTIYSKNWDTTQVSNGSHLVSAIAYDTSNNSSTATTSVTVANASQSPPPSSPGVNVGVAASYGTPNWIPTGPDALPGDSSQSSVSTSSLQNQLNALLVELDALEVQAGQSTPISSIFSFSRNLSLWSTGSDVQELQQFLINRNTGPAARKLAVHGTTEVFGYLTLNALIEYQASVGLPATGYFGPLTRAELNGL